MQVYLHAYKFNCNISVLISILMKFQKYLHRNLHATVQLQFQFPFQYLKIIRTNENLLALIQIFLRPTFFFKTLLKPI
jgi:hypothetical protein